MTEGGRVDAIERDGTEGASHPLSAPQASIWTDWAGKPDRGAYNISDVVDLKGPLDAALLRRAIEATDAAADSLTLRLEAPDSQPVQHFSARPHRFDFALIDLSGSDAPDGLSRIEIESARKRPFDLHAGPTARHRLIRLAPDHHQWVRIYHHLAIDAAGALLLCQQVGAIYNALRRGEAPPAADFHSYRAFLEQDALYPATTAAAADLAYWRERLRDDIPAHRFVTKPGPPPDEVDPETLVQTLSRQRLNAIEGAARTLGGSRVSLLLGLFLVLLGRSAATTTPSCLTVFANRLGRTNRRTPGQFSLSVPIWARIAPETRLSDLIRSLSATSQRDLRHMRLASSRMRAAGLAPRALSGRGAMFNALDFSQALVFDGLTARIGAMASGPVHDLTLRLISYGETDRTRLDWIYPAGRIDRTTVARLADRFNALLDAVIAAPDQTIAALPRFSPAERAQLEFWETGPASPPICRADLLPHRVRATAAAYPDRIAARDGAESVDYRTLLARADRVAHALCARGLGPGSIVGLCLEPSVAQVAGALGTLIAGAAVMPLDPALPPQRLSAMVAARGPGAILIHPPTRARIEPGLAPLIDPTDLPEIPEDGSGPEIDARSLAFVHHTSGSTGQPKAVEIPHGAMARKMRDTPALVGLAPGDSTEPEVICISTAIGFDVWGLLVFLGLTGGHRLWLPSRAEISESFAFWRGLEREEVTHLNLVPSQLDGLLPGLPEGIRLRLRRLVLGGEAVRPDLAARAATLLAVPAIWNLYGSTETTIDATAYRLPLDRTLTTIPIGAPLPGYVTRVLDERMERVAIGTQGTLYIGGSGLARGYADQPEATARAFLADPFGPPGARLYCSGDCVSWGEDGMLRHHGRADDQVKSRGQRIEIGEIETALRACAGVTDAAALIDHSGDDARLVAFYCGPTEAATLARTLAEQLPAAAVPARFHPLPALPHHPSGKIDRAALATMAATTPSAAPADTPPAPRPQATAIPFSEADQIVLQRAFTQVWAELLGEEGLNPDADIFQNGAYSLLVLQAQPILSRLAGCEISANDLFQFPSAAALAAHLRGTTTAPPAATSFALPPVLEGQWLARRDGGGTTTYLIRFDKQLPAGTTRPALIEALTRLVARHAALRSTFAEHNGTVRQIVAPPGAPIEWLRFDDVAALDAPFDPTVGPLIRFGLSDDDPIRLRVTVDHIVFDGQSRLIFLRELEALLAGRPLAPAPPDTARADEAAHIDGEPGQSARRFWAERVARLPSRPLPGEPDPVTAGGRVGRRHLLPLPESSIQALKSLVARGNTPTGVWTALVAALLWRHKEEAETISIGLPFAGRRNDLDARSIGCFVNVLPVTVRPDAGAGLAALARRVRSEIAETLAHQTFPLSRLTAEWARRVPERGPEPFDAVCVLEDKIVAVEDGKIDLAAGKFPLLLGLMWQDDRATITIEVDAARFGTAWVERVSRRLLALIDAAAADPDAALDRLPLLPESERHRVLRDFNTTTRPYPREAGLGQLLDRALGEVPSRPALSDGTLVLDGHRLRRRIAGQAAALTAAGIRPGDVVGLGVERGLPGLVGLLGIVWAGAAYVPLDPAFPCETASRLLSTAGGRVLLADAPGLERWQGLEPDIALIALIETEADCPPAPRDGGDTACVLYTSGSTGEPKGVMVPHRAIARLALGSLPFPPGQTFGQAAPLAFDATSLELWGPLLTGGAVRVIPEASLFDPTALEEDIKGGGISAMWLTSSLLNLIIDERPQTLAELTRLYCGGEALSPPHIARLISACPGLTVVNGYGPTENATFTTTHTLTAADLNGQPIPIGRPIANSRVYVLDATMQPAPIGLWGELYAAGDGLALGYAGRDDLTEAAFVTVPGLDEPRLYRTGDRARWRDDGVLEFGGRRDGQVKIRGHRIETDAIKAALATLPGLRESALAVIGDGADRTLAALVVAEAIDIKGWKRALAATLPAYMVPERFVVTDRLPLTVTGKTDQAAVVRLLSRRAAAPTDQPRPPAPGLEQTVAEAFAALFDGAEISAESDFFHLGGHSLKAMRLASLLEESTGQRPTLAGLLTARTVAAIARQLDSPNVARPAADPGNTIPRAAGTAGAEYPLSSGQARLWVMQRLYPDSAAYSIPLTLEITGPLDPEALATALEGLEERHHALRLRFVTRRDDPDGVRQVLAPPGGLRPRRLDLDDAAARTFIAAESARPFDLTRDPPARAVLIRLAPDGTRHWLLLVIHHALCDGGSMPIILRDLSALYQAAHERRPADLVPLPVQFEDVAAWQRQRLASAEGQAVLERWRARLTPLPAPQTLPPDRPRPPQRRFAGAMRVWDVDPATARQISTVAASAETTPFAVLAALVQVLLYRHCGHTDLALGLLVDGRNRPVPPDLVGFLVNTVVLRQNIDPDSPFALHLATTKRHLLAAIEDQDAPFEAVIATLAVPRDTDRNPLFDVLMTWQDDPPPLPNPPGLTFAFVETPFPFAKVDLSFHFQRDGDRLRCHIEYDTDLYDPETIDRLWLRLATLAQALDSPVPLSALPLLPVAEQARLAAWNATERELPTRRTIAMPWLDQVAATPDAIALLAPGATLDYATFAARAAGLARRLTEAGLRAGDIVAITLPRSVDMLVAIHAVLLAGGAYCPLDPDVPEARRAMMIEDLGEPWFVTDDAGAKGGPAEARRVVMAGDDTAPLPPPPSDPDALAYVLFTSGSTGRPKGVEIEHHAVLNRILWMQETFPIGPGDVILHKTPIGFDVSVWEVLWWSWTGAAVAAPPPGTEKNPQALAEAIAAFGVTVIHFVPSMLRAFLDALETGSIEAEPLARLRWVFASGEALDAATVRRFNRLLYDRFGTELHNLYGPTEATVDVTWQPCSPWNETQTVVPIGRPIANTRVHIQDAAGRTVPPGAVGEIVLAGPQVARGYHHRPDLTAERFLADPDAPGGRRYRTGDLGRFRTDGAVEYLGRTDDQVKVRGTRIELGEVEAALDACPGITRGLARVVERQGLTELHAFVQGEASLTAAGLRAALRARLPEAMVPSRFFRIDSVPLTPNGKVDRKALSGTLLGSTSSAADRAPPLAGQIETDVTALWREVLPGIAFGRDDGFFDVGGTSLLLLRLHEALNARWPGAFRVAELFSCATIAAQVARLEDTAAAITTPRRVMPRSGTDSSGGDSGKVAIIGLAVRVAGAEDAETLWRDVVAGADRIGPMPPARDSMVRALAAAIGLPLPVRFREAAYLDDIDGFDPSRFRFSPADAALIDPEQRLFLETAARAVDDAGLNGGALTGRTVAVYVGGSANPIYRLALQRLPASRAEAAFALNVPSNLATRLGFLQDWHGPAALIDTACSSGLVAVDAACRDLLNDRAEIALAGAARLILLPPDEDSRFTIESSTGRTHAFAADADGTGSGEGAVALVLKRLDRAIADHDPIHAVILGSATNQDGASSGAAAPNPEAQADVIRTAWGRAGADLATASYIEAHGTGTRLGDPIEIEGLTRAVTEPCTETGFALIGSAKGNYGHLDNAAGALGLVRAVLALRHDTAPPQPFFDQPNPAIDFDHAPVRVASVATPLPDRGCRRRAGISSFGLSGINAHVVIEAPPAQPDNATDAVSAGWVTVALSAGDDAALIAFAEALRRAISADPALTPVDIARTLAEGRDALASRFAVAVSDRAGLLAGLDRLIEGDRADTASVATGRSRTGRAPVAVWSADHTSANAAAKAFLAGADPIWPKDAPGRRRHLPPTPFCRRPCRLDLPAAPLPPVQALLPDHVTALPDGCALAVPLDAPWFWPVAEHRLGGHPTLVGMAVPALIAAALARTRGGSDGFTLSDLMWLRPLRAGLGQASLILGNDGRARLGVRSEHGDWMPCAEARIDPHPPAPPPADPVDLSPAGLIPLELATFTGSFSAVEVSQRWDCCRATWIAPDRSRVLAHLALPTAYSSDGADLAFHPAVLDVAASLLIEPGQVPRSCARIELWRPLPPLTVACIDRIAPDAVTVRLCDQSGGLCARLTGLRFAQVGAAGSPSLAVPVWSPDDSGSSPVPAPLPSGTRIVTTPEDIAPDDTDATAPLVLTLAADESLAQRTALALRAATAASARGRPILVIGQGAFGPPEDTLAPDPRWALAAGLVLAAAQEYPGLDLRYLDVPADQTLAAAADELARPKPASPWSVWRHGRRFVRSFVSLTERETDPQTGLAAGPKGWPETGVCVVSGGSGGFAATLAETMSAGGSVALALLSRHAAPSVEMEATLDTLRAAGATIRLYRCDVADRAALAETLVRIRADMGPITAVAHMAGIADGGFLAVRDMAAFNDVLAAKVEGARHLDALTRDDPLRAFVLFSSLTGVLGAPGQTAYAAANAWLDGFAAWRRQRGCPAQSINWCALRDLGMAARADRPMAEGWSITPTEAVMAWSRILVGGRVQTALLDPHRLVAAAAAMGAPDAEKTTEPAPPLSLEERIAAIWAEILGHPLVDPDDDFFTLGGDSLSGLDITEAISKAVGTTVSVSDLFEHSTPRALAASLTVPTTPDVIPNVPSIPDDPRRAPPSATYPLAWEQLAVMQAEAMGETGTAYTLPHAIDLPPKIDLDRLRGAVAALVRHHAALRTCVERDDETWRMRPLDPTLAIPALPLVETAEPLEVALLARIKPLDFEAGPPVRWVLLRDASGRMALLFDIHHVLADAIAVERLLTDLGRLYAGQTLPPPAFDLLDYGWWSMTSPAAPDPAAARAYWHQMFAGPLPMLDLPSDRPRPKRSTHRIGVHTFAFAPTRVSRLRAFAPVERITPFTLVLSAWAILLRRLAETDDVVIAVAVNTRSVTGFDGAVGMMSGLVPLRLGLDQATTGRTLFRLAQDRHTQAMRHCVYGLGRLLSDLAPPVTPNRSLLSEVTVSYMNHAGTATGSLNDTGLSGRGLMRDSGRTDLSIFVADQPEGISVTVEYDSALFEPARIAAWGTMLQTLLDDLMTRPDTPVDHLRLLDDDAQERWLRDGSIEAETDPLAQVKSHEPTTHRPGPPATAAEEMVASVFAAVFEQPILDRTADFNDLGGHSLLAIRAVNRLAQWSKIRLGMADFFADPTVAGLARHFEPPSAPSPTAPSPTAPSPTATRDDATIPRVTEAAVYPASHGQQRLYLVQGMAPDSPAYVMLFALPCGAVSTPALESALGDLARRHETLRTGFDMVDGRIVQRIVDAAPALVETNLSATPDRRTEALRLARREAATPFDLTRPPLIRGHLIRLGSEDSLLLLALHHIVGDGWSARILQGELSHLYAARRDSRPATLAPLPITYKDYAAWQTGRGWYAEEAYWRQRLAGAPQAIALPTDRPAPPTPSGRGGSVQRDLPPALLEGLHALARRHNASMATIGLALFTAVLYRLTRQGDMVIGMGVAGRDRAETEGLIGFFVNVLPIRVRLDDDTELAALIADIRAGMIAALDRRDYPFDLLVRAVAPQRSAGRQPLVNVVFEYQRFEAVTGPDTPAPGSPGSNDLRPTGSGVLESDLADIVASRTAKHDLIAFFTEDAGQARLALDYDSDLFDGPTVEKWLSYVLRFADLATAPTDGSTDP